MTQSLHTPLSTEGDLMISLNDLRFHAHHGVMPQEREVGAEFSLTLRLYIYECEAQDALFDDKLDGTVNYAEVYDLVKKEMSTPSALLEHVAARIAKSLIRAFDKIHKVDVSLTKCAPPIAGYDAQGVSIHYSLERELVAWDFDGTIADTSAGIIRTMTATFREMGFTPLPSDREICSTIGLPLNTSIAQLAHLGVNSPEVIQAADTYRRLFEEVGTTGITLFPGVKEEMAREHRNGRFVAIATSRGHESVDALCQMLGIRQYVDFIVACEDVGTHKPDPAPIFRLCELAHVRPSAVTVIGDTTYDIHMGRNAHAAHCIGVSWGNHTAETMLEAGAERVIDAF